MEAVLVHTTNPDKSISPNKYQIRKKSIHGSFISKSSENFFPVYSDLLSSIHGGLGGGGGGLFFGPQLPNFSSSYYSSVPIFNQQHQPPLLPLPVTKPYYSSVPVGNNNKSLPFSPINKKNNNRSTRDQDHHLTPKKSKSHSISPKKQNNSPPKQDSTSIAKRETLVISSTKRLGPEPSDLPKQVSRVLKPVASSSSATTVIASATTMEGVEEFSSSIFSLAPPPSSLPLPKFSLRPKLIRCNVEAGGVDDGATDNLRRLLRLR